MQIKQVASNPSINNFKSGWGIMLGVEILLFIEIPSKGNRMVKIRSDPLMLEGLFPFLSTFNW